MPSYNTSRPKVLYPGTFAVLIDSSDSSVTSSQQVAISAGAGNGGIIISNSTDQTASLSWSPDDVIYEPFEGVVIPSNSAVSANIQAGYVRVEFTVPSTTGSVTVEAGASSSVSSGSSSGSGISGLTAGYYPVAATSSTLGNGNINTGITFPNTLFIDGTGVNGAPASVFIAGGVFIDAVGGDVITGSADGAVDISAGQGLTLSNTPATGTYKTAITIYNGDTGGTNITDSGGGGILISETGGGGISLNSNNAGVTFDSILIPGLLYSAGIPLPTANTVPAGSQAVVSDALLPTYMGAYQGGGGVICAVICDGSTGWFTH